MILPDMQNAPADNEGAATALNDNLSLADTAHGSDPTGLVSGVYVAVVQVRGDHVPPRYRRRILLSLAAAQRAVDRATMDGLDASIGLYQLIPAGGAK